MSLALPRSAAALLSEPKVFCTCASRVRTSTPFCYGSAHALLFADVKCCWSRVPLKADMAHAAVLFRNVVHPPGGPFVVSQEAARGIGIGACAVAFAVHCHCHTHTSLYVMLQCLGAEQPHAAGEAFCAFASPRDDDDDVRVVALNG